MSDTPSLTGRAGVGLLLLKAVGLILLSLTLM